MDALEGFEQSETHASYRPRGNVDLQQAFDLIAAAIAYARERQIRRLLVDTTSLSGFTPPRTSQRILMGEQLAEAGRSRVKVVLVARKEMIDVERIGVTVLRNRGLLAEVFELERDALAWLLDPHVE